MDKITSAILNLIWNNAGCTFGGFVRDMFRGEEPNDIDCYFNNDRATVRFLESLAQQFGSFQVIRNTDYDTVYPLMHLVVSGKQIDISSEPFMYPDFDVNALSMYRDKLSVEGLVGYLTVADILRNIRNHVAVQLPDCLDFRAEKMRKKGWTIIGLDGNAIDDVTVADGDYYDRSITEPCW